MKLESVKTNIKKLIYHLIENFFDKNATESLKFKNYRRLKIDKPRIIILNVFKQYLAMLSLVFCLIHYKQKLEKKSNYIKHPRLSDDAISIQSFTLLNLSSRMFTV